MQETLINLGAEVLSVTTEMITNEVALYLTLVICILLVVVGVDVFFWLGQSNSYPSLFLDVITNFCRVFIIVSAMSILINVLFID